MKSGSYISEAAILAIAAIGSSVAFDARPAFADGAVGSGIRVGAPSRETRGSGASVAIEPENLQSRSVVLGSEAGKAAVRPATPQGRIFLGTERPQATMGGTRSQQIVEGGSVSLATSTGNVTSDRGRAEGLFMDFRAVELGGMPLGFPLSGGRMSSGFGMRTHPSLGGYRMHSGLDLAAATGTPVRATSSGFVSKAGWFGSYGLFVAVNHGSGLQTRYAHLSRLNVSSGQAVSRGDIVGFVGSTGRSTGPHLHYEVRKYGNAVDPLRQ